MSDTDTQSTDAAQNLRGRTDELKRQTVALERIAEALDDLRAQFKTVGDALNRLANRAGRHDD
jgi:hypothetical protein